MDLCQQLTVHRRQQIVIIEIKRTKTTTGCGPLTVSSGLKFNSHFLNDATLSTFTTSLSGTWSYAKFSAALDGWQSPYGGLHRRRARDQRFSIDDWVFGWQSGDGWFAADDRLHRRWARDE